MTEPTSVKGILTTISKTGGLRIAGNETWYNPSTSDARQIVKEDFKGREVEIFLNGNGTNYLTVICLDHTEPIKPAGTLPKIETKEQGNLLKDDIPAEYIKSLQGKEFITHQGLLWMAHKKGLKEVHTEIASLEPIIILKATVVMQDGSSFQAYGDATDENVNAQIKPHKIRMAETRAVNRALRLATNLGMTSAEELGGD